ncbi:putative glycosyltransferase [Hyella patelloides LEGE 07179]|uniref:Putative glycosyltransferase n=1 Tax=Hyella patelloides LEGE 07179 TaxID=945734 RepID=A0A563W3R7_9CYAN|nr:tetratricopeptide repeat protein [Hyella patelloides]VEP18324.1 putative glycosyltransferase [Hyella patelloides LEGE 07179]
MTELSISQIKLFQDCLKKAEDYKHKGQLEAAIDCYQEATKINPHSATAYHGLGNIYLSLSKWSEAIEIYQTVLKINPNFDWGYYNLGEAYYYLKRWEDAVIAYQKALDLNPNLPHIYKKLANTFYQRANLDRESLLATYQKKIQDEPYEIQNYHQAIELKPQDVDLYLGLGNALIYNRKIDEAIVAYRMALQVDPNYEPAKLQLDTLRNQFQDTETTPQPVIESLPELKLQQAKQAINSLSQIILDNFLLSNSKIDFPNTIEPLVSIILILYNRAELTLSCLHSLLHQNFTNYEVIIVDNNSEDRTKELLAKIPRAKIIFNEENKHFLLAANQASGVAAGQYLLFLNNDTQILGDSLNSAIETISSDPDIGAVGGKIILPDGTLQEAGSIIWQDGSCLGYGRGDNPQASQYMFTREVDYCSGAFLLTPRQLFFELGSFNILYQPAYYEETDYCVKIHKAGKKVIYDPNVTIFHYEFASSKKSDRAIALQQKNQEIFVTQHQDWLQSQYKPNLNNILLASNRKNADSRILFIEDRVPHPYLGSGYTRGYQILQNMTKLGHTITFYPTDLSYQETWQEIYQDIPQNIEIATGYGLQKLAVFFKIRPEYYDIIFVSRPHNMNHLNYILQQNNLLTKTKIIYDAEALYCLRDFAYQALQGKQLTEEEKQEAIADELRLAKKSNLIISVSPLEQQKFLEYGYKQVEILGHSLDITPTPNSFEQRKDILFVGSIYELQSPNADSILWFSQEIFSLIQQQISSEINLLLVGNNQVPQLNSIILSLNNPQIKLLGKVDNLYNLYNNSRLFIAPTRFAAGIPHKVHEASTYGLPVVTTKAIANQLQWQHETDLLVANNPQDFADQCIRLYRDKNLWQTLRNNALQQIEKQCSPEYFKNKLQEILTKI